MTAAAAASSTTASVAPAAATRPAAEPAAAPLLAARGLSKRYGTLEVLREVTLELRAGEVVGLLGPNGAGKTTCFRLLLGLDRPDAGAVLMDGRDVTRAPAHRRARAGLGYLPQDASVFRGLRAWENVAVALEGLPAPDRPRDAAALRRRAVEVLAEFGLDAALADRGAAVLSGGERRRLEIARAMAARPAVLLLDEPFAGVDPRGVAELRATIAALRGRGVALLVTDHRVAETLAVCDRAYVLDRGVLLCEGTPTEVAAHPGARAAFLGPDFRLS
ncbi:MAG TPA: LPS export ABC transporter ATP-binding protein [Myxococcota bacterium]|nr:LPS export ABC transporter ATP-binding protein [Myxococcota bacterium]